MNTNNQTLTKRELIAAMAMQGMLASGKTYLLSDGQLRKCCAYADALLEELAGASNEKRSIYSLEDND